MSPGRHEKEIANLARVEEAVSSYVHQGRSLGPGVVLGLHGMLMEGIPEDPGRPVRPGKLRTVTERVQARGVGHLTGLMTPAMSVRSELLDLLDAAENSRLTREDPVLQVPRFHYRFVRIHPFCDGNGRMARVLSWWLMARTDPDVLNLKVPINSVLLEYREDYIGVLEYCDGLYSQLRQDGLDHDASMEWCEVPFVVFYLRALTRSYTHELGEESGAEARRSSLDQHSLKLEDIRSEFSEADIRAKAALEGAEG